MLESLDNAKEELKRADHLFYVSLKYTRTVDVIKSVIERLINACAFGIESLLLYLKEQGKIPHVPELLRERVELVKKEFAADPFIQENIGFFLLLRKIDKAPFTRKQEFRRHVTMTVEVDEKKIEIKIDDVKEYFEKIKNFIAHIEKLIEGKEEE